MIASDIITALSSFKIPIATESYTGNAENYIEIDMTEERFDGRADDAPIFFIESADINLYTKQNPTTLKTQISTALWAADFNIESMDFVGWDNELKRYLYVITVTKYNIMGD